MDCRLPTRVIHLAGGFSCNDDCLQACGRFGIHPDIGGRHKDLLDLPLLNESRQTIQVMHHVPPDNMKGTGAKKIVTVKYGCRCKIKWCHHPALQLRILVFFRRFQRLRVQAPVFMKDSLGVSRRPGCIHGIAGIMYIRFFITGQILLLFHNLRIQRFIKHADAAGVFPDIGNALFRIILLQRDVGRPCAKDAGDAGIIPRAAWHHDLHHGFPAHSPALQIAVYLSGFHVQFTISHGSLIVNNSRAVFITPHDPGHTVHKTRNIRQSACLAEANAILSHYLFHCIHILRPFKILIDGQIAAVSHCRKTEDHR